MKKPISSWRLILWRIFCEQKQPTHDEVMAGKDEVMQKNIYDGKSVKGMAKKFHRIHFKFKYRFMVPLLLLGDKILGKSKIKKIPNEPWNKNFKIFDEAFEEALDDWTFKFLMSVNCWSPERAEKHRRSDRAIKMLTSMKEWYYTINLTDTAYRELHNILMHKIAEKMFKYHKTENPVHVFYRSKNCYNPLYFNIWRVLENGEIELKIAEGRGEQLKKKKSDASDAVDAVTSK